jgi:hypothetical protein
LRCLMISPQRYFLAATLGLISIALVYGQEKPTRLAFDVTSVRGCPLFS